MSRIILLLLLSLLIEKQQIAIHFCIIRNSLPERYMALEMK